MYRRYLKRIFDFIAALLCLFFFSPIFVVLTIILFFLNKRKPFFTQVRPGKNEHLFKIIKFKTMNDRRDKQGKLLPDDERLTIVGKIVRKTSLDEIPQLINVIKGDMSFIGPRPLLPEYLAIYSDYHSRRHEVTPGITGWAQVNGRQSIKLSKRRDLDIWYVDHVSFALDCKILFMTVNNVIKGKDIKSGQSMANVDDLGFEKAIKN